MTGPANPAAGQAGAEVAAAYMLKRLGLAIAVALTVSMLAFLLLRLSGDPAIAIAGEGARSGRHRD